MASQVRPTARMPNCQIANDQGRQRQNNQRALWLPASLDLMTAQRRQGRGLDQRPAADAGKALPHGPGTRHQGIQCTSGDIVQQTGLVMGSYLEPGVISLVSTADPDPA